MRRFDDMAKSKTGKNLEDAEVAVANALKKVRDGDYPPSESRVIEKFKAMIRKGDALKYASAGDGKPLELRGDPVLTMAKLAEAFGTSDYALQMFLLNQVVPTFRGCQSSEGYSGAEKQAEFCNATMAILNGIKPQDEIEGLLAVQMIGVHNLAMDCLKKAMISDQYPQAIDANTTRAAKLLRVFNMQIETLKKHRTGGQQKMTIEHVHVHQGGQAIVGNVQQGGGGKLAE
jgi:hypothetical protein